MGQKRADTETLPLCRIHHEEQHRVGWPRFIQLYELDVPAILAELREKPRLVILNGRAVQELGWGPRYVAQYRGQEFGLKHVGDGLEASLDCAFRVCGEYLRDQLLQRRAA